MNVSYIKKNRAILNTNKLGNIFIAEGPFEKNQTEMVRIHFVAGLGLSSITIDRLIDDDDDDNVGGCGAYEDAGLT
jgi:hypothetical protein